MFLVVRVKPVKAKLLPNLILFKNCIKCCCLEQNVPNCLDAIVLDLVPLIILSKGARAALDSGEISSIISSEETPDIILKKNV